MANPILQDLADTFVRLSNGRIARIPAGSPIPKNSSIVPRFESPLPAAVGAGERAAAAAASKVDPAEYTLEHWNNLINSAAKQPGAEAIIPDLRNQALDRLSQTYMIKHPSISKEINIAPNNPDHVVWFEPAGGGQAFRATKGSKGFDNITQALGADGKPKYQQITPTEEALRGQIAGVEHDPILQAQVQAKAEKDAAEQAAAETARKADISGAKRDAALYAAPLATAGVLAANTGVYAPSTPKADASAATPSGPNTSTTTPITAPNAPPSNVPASSPSGSLPMFAQMPDQMMAATTNNLSSILGNANSPGGYQNRFPDISSQSTSQPAAIRPPASKLLSDPYPNRPDVPRRPADLDQSSGNIIERAVNAVRNIGKGPDILSTGKDVTSDGRVNWISNPDEMSAADFAKLSQAQSQLNQQPQPSAEKRGGRVNKTNEHSAILHKALEIIHHMALKP